jgi:hypothetical protein
MITLTTGQKVFDTDQVVVTGGDYNEEENVLVIGEDGKESFLQVYYIEYGVVYANRVE